MGSYIECVQKKDKDPSTRNTIETCMTYKQRRCQKMQCNECIIVTTNCRSIACVSTYV